MKLHPHIIVLEGRDTWDEELAAAFPEDLHVLRWIHGAALPAGKGPSVSCAGSRTVIDLDGHPDAAFLTAAAQEADVLLVRGTVPDGALRLRILDGSETLDDLRGAAALWGRTPPPRTPPGGIPFFRHGDSRELADHLRERLEDGTRDMPVFGLVAGASSLKAATAAASLLAGAVPEILVAGEAEWLGGLSAPLLGMPRNLAGAGYLGDLLTAAQARPGSAFLTVSCREGDTATSGDAGQLLAQRAPLLDATAFRGREDSLPRNGIVLWESGGLSRLWNFLAAGTHCPQRTLNQCRVKLLPAA